MRAPNNQTTTGFRISDGLLAVLEPLLPVHVNSHRFGGGRPRVPDQVCADAIFYVLRTGCQWQALDQTEWCAHSTAHDRFQAWVEAGVFLLLWQAGVARFDELRGIEWDWLAMDGAMDGAMTKAPLGGGKNGAQSHRPGQVRRQTQPADRGASNPNRSGGAGANRRDLKRARATLATLASLIVARPVPTPEPPQGTCLDAGYDSDEVDALVPEFGCTAHVRPRGAEAQAIQHEAGCKARRWVVARAHSWMNRFRRLLIRWERKPENYLAFLHFACGLIAFRAAGLFE